MRVNWRTMRWIMNFLVKIFHSTMTLTTTIKHLTISMIMIVARRIPTLDTVLLIMHTTTDKTITMNMIATCRRSRVKGRHTGHLITTMRLSGLKHSTDTTITIQFRKCMIWWHTTDMLNSQKINTATRNKCRHTTTTLATTNGMGASKPICINRNRVVVKVSCTVITEATGTTKMEMQHMADMFKTREITTIEHLLDIFSAKRY